MLKARSHIISDAEARAIIAQGEAVFAVIVRGCITLTADEEAAYAMADKNGTPVLDYESGMRV